MTRLSLLVICDIDFIHINIYNLLLKTYLSLIFIKYFINEYRVKIKFLEQKYFAKEIKGLEICTVDLELESGRAPLVRAWDSRGFTRSPGPTKCAFRGVRFPRIQKKKLLHQKIVPKYSWLMLY